MPEVVGIKILVLILATSLLGGAPACLCQDHAQPKPKETSCGHCPTKPAPEKNGHSSSDCCCVHAGTDRASEQEYSVQQPSFSVDLDVMPAAVGSDLFGPVVSGHPSAIGTANRPRLPLYLLHQHLTI